MYKKKIISQVEHLQYRCKREFLLHYLPSLLIPTFPCSCIFFVMQHAGIELGPHCYDATLLIQLHGDGGQVLAYSTCCLYQSNKLQAIPITLFVFVPGIQAKRQVDYGSKLHTGTLGMCKVILCDVPSLVIL